VCPEVTVTVVQILEICAIFAGIVGVNDENQPLGIIPVEPFGPKVRLPPKAVIDDFRAKPRAVPLPEVSGDSSGASPHNCPARLIYP
jgi:hypothetical protein